MTKSIILLSGWGQKFNSLESSFNLPAFDDFNISSLDYSKFDNIDRFFQSISEQNLQPEIIVGWSLGGQLAIRLIAKKILNPKYLILIAPPFQMVKNHDISAAMSQSNFKEFYNNFKNNPNFTLKKFSILAAMNDKNSKEIANNLDINDKNFNNLTYWLEELERFSFVNFDFKEINKTLFFQGKGDMIVHYLQAKYFQKQIKDFKLEIFNNCGHAPHLSNNLNFQQKIIDFITNN